MSYRRRANQTALLEKRKEGSFALSPIPLTRWGVGVYACEKGTTPWDDTHARSKGIHVLGRERLLQLCVLGLGLLQDGDVGVGVFPARLDYCGSPILYSRSAKRRSDRRSWNLGSVFIEVIQ